MRRALRLLAVVAAGAAAGCAALIGASFDGATLADAGDAMTFPDAYNPDGAVDPRSLGGLALWLDATTLIEVDAGAVLRWHDRSGNVRDAVPAGGGSQPPTLGSGIHGRPSIHFTAASAQLLVTPWTGPGGSALTVFVVGNGRPQSAVRFQSDATQPPAAIFPFDLGATGEAGPDFGFYVTGAPFARAPVRVGPQLLTARFESGATATWDNGQLVEQHLAAGVTMLPTDQTLYIGGALPLLAAPATASQLFDGDLGEILVYDSALSESDRAAVEAYLRDKWGI